MIFKYHFSLLIIFEMSKQSQLQHLKNKLQNQATGAEVQIGKNHLKGLSQPGMPLCPTMRKPIMHQLRV